MLGAPNYGLAVPTFQCLKLETEIFNVVSVRMRENVDQNNSEYRHFSRSTSHTIITTNFIQKIFVVQNVYR